MYYQVCYLIPTCLRNFSNNLSLLKKNSWVNCIWFWEWIYIHKRILKFKFVEICFAAQSVVKLNECSLWTWNEFMWLWLLDKIVDGINYSHWIDGGVESNDIFVDGLPADSVPCRSTHFCFMCFDVQLVGTCTLKTDIFLKNWPFTYYETPLCLLDICYPWQLSLLWNCLECGLLLGSVRVRCIFCPFCVNHMGPWVENRSQIDYIWTMFLIHFH